MALDVMIILALAVITAAIVFGAERGREPRSLSGERVLAYAALGVAFLVMIIIAVLV